MQTKHLILSLIILELSSSSFHASCAFIPSKSRSSGEISKFPNIEDKKASFILGNATTTPTTSAPTSLPSLLDDESITSISTSITSNFDSMEFNPTEISPSQSPKCSPPGYPCTPDIVKMKLRNNSMYTSSKYQEPTPCCSGTCQYEEGWIDATCE